MNKYGYNKRFIIIYGSGRFNAQEIREIHREWRHTVYLEKGTQ